ncbi:hypothetical protein DENSPDRAFT_886654 [Dentipellis sp. KUC8613]|nr:hypothetical protein DENSPDRAFT_886654 [Dentipellis sp. KUC8613]
MPPHGPATPSRAAAWCPRAALTRSHLPYRHSLPPAVAPCPISRPLAPSRARVRSQAQLTPPRVHQSAPCTPSSPTRTTTSPWRRRGSRRKGTSPALTPSSSLPPTPPLVCAGARPHPLMSLPGFALARPPRVLAPLALPRGSLTPSHPSRTSSCPSRPRLNCLAPSHLRRARVSSCRRVHLARLACLSRALVAPLHHRAGPAPLHPFRARRALFAP